MKRGGAIYEQSEEMRKMKRKKEVGIVTTPYIMALAIGICPPRRTPSKYFPGPSILTVDLEQNAVRQLIKTNNNHKPNSSPILTLTLTNFFHYFNHILSAPKCNVTKDSNTTYCLVSSV